MRNFARRPVTGFVPLLIALLGVISPYQLYAAEAGSEFGDLYAANCAVCHGAQLEGAAQGAPLLGVELKHGQDVEQLITSISDGFPTQGMPAWQDILTHEQIKSLALWISENRSGLLYSDFKIDSELRIPTAVQPSEYHNFVFTTVADHIDPLPFSIAPMPDGQILVTEKMRGLRIVGVDGSLSPLITGTPATFGDARKGGGGLEYGMGWLLDVALHPNYANNGWVYLHYTDRCEGCNDISIEMRRPVSMNALVRGRIENNRWVDEETIWKADLAHYSPASDVAAGGRIAFDPDGFVFLSIGMQSIDLIQDLSAPHGKILRLHDDGRIPADNPFIDHPTANKAIWSYGHRSPQGLEFDPIERKLWETEHGPRGGDEVNLLLPGHNYGWPAFSKGQNYNGSQVNWGRKQGIELELKDIDQPIVDLTPSPAVSSFVLYEADAFPAWKHQFLIGSLKAADVYRMKIEDNKLVEQELLIKDLARVRDIEVDHNGHILLLLEHASGGRIVRVSPALTGQQATAAAPQNNNRERNMGRIAGKVAIITGGASGIGRGCAERLSAEGATVVVTDIDTTLGEQTVASIVKTGGKAEFMQHDVTLESDWVNVVEQTVARHGGLHILVNNAGIGIGGSIVEMALEDWQRQQAINLDGVFLGIKHAIPAMRDSGSGSIINMSSVAGLKGAANLAAYNATKGGVRLLTKGVALECAQSRWPIRVNSVHPGVIDTPIWTKVNPEFLEEGENAVDVEAMATLGVPTGEVGYPLDIANGVLFLASDESRYITGTELVIDGGLSA